MTQPIQLISGGAAAGGLRLRSFGVGRLVLVLPKSQRQATYDSSGPKEEFICDIVALDGGPIYFGGEGKSDGTMKSPDTMTVVPAPFWVGENAIIGGKALARSLAAGLPNPMIGKPGSGLVGRLWKDPQFNDAWKLKDPTPQEMQLAQQFLDMAGSGQFVNPVPRLIAGPPAQGTPQVSYGAAPAAPVIPQQAPMGQSPYGQQGGYAAPVNPQQPAWPVQQQAAPAVPQPGYAPQPQAPAQPVAPVQDSPAPGWSPEAWAGLTEDQRAQLRAMNGMPAVAAPQAPAQAYSY